MAHQVVADLSVRVSKYVQNGQEKWRYRTVGSVLQDTETGRRMCVLHRTFNPAGCPDDGRDSIILYEFEKNSERDNSRRYEQRVKQDYSSIDDIPF